MQIKVWHNSFHFANTQVKQFQLNVIGDLYEIQIQE